jgi:hypothetical protein
VNDKAASGAATKRLLGNVLPRHWTPADPNGARRWGLSFGAGVVLFVVVGAFGIYMAAAEFDDSAWSRANTPHTRESPTGASDAFAQRDAPLPSTSALVASLKAQIANAYAEAAADADRLRVPPSLEHRAKERPRPVPAQQTAPTEHMGRTSETSATPALRAPMPEQRPSTRAAPAQASHAQEAASVARRSVVTRASPPGSAPLARPAPSRPAAIHPIEDDAKPTAADAAAQRNAASPAIPPDAAHLPLLRAAPADLVPGQSDTPSVSVVPAPSPPNGIEATPPRPSPPAESREHTATPPCGSEEGSSGCSRPSAAEPGSIAPREAVPPASAPVERAAPAAPAAQQGAKPPVSSLYRGASTVIKRRPPSSNAQSASPNRGSSRAGRRVASSGQPRTQRSDAVPHPAPTAITLPRFFSALWPPAFSPPLPKPPPPIDLSDNQRSLYRGH